MGYYATIIMIGVFFLGGVTIVTMKSDTSDADLAVADHQQKYLAREAAHTGLQMTVWKLAESYNMLSWTYGTDYPMFTNVAYNGGSYSVSVTTANPTGSGAVGDTVNVVSRGKSGDVRHVIFARYARDKDDKGVPPAFENAISSDFYMQFSGDMLVASIDETRNASIHTNDDLDLRGNSFRVEGFGTYSGTVRINPAAEDNFDPPDDLGQDPPYHMWAPEINIPAIDSVGLKSMAQSQGLYFDQGGYSSTTPLVVDGDATPVLDFTDPSHAGWATMFGGSGGYSCTTPCGSPENPGVLYVDGPVDFLNRVQINGHGVVIASGDVRVIPNGHGGGFFGELTSENQETKLLLATLQDLVIGHGGGNACMGLGPPGLGTEDKVNNHCQSGNGGADGYTHGVSAYAEGRVEMIGTPVIVGGLVANETYMDNGGNPSIVYASANEGTIDAGFEYIVAIGPILIAFSEF